MKQKTYPDGEADGFTGIWLHRGQIPGTTTSCCCWSLDKNGGGTGAG